MANLNMRKLLSLCLFFLFTSFSLSANVLDDLIIKKKPAINQIVIELLQGGLTEQTDNSNAQLAREICRAGGASSRTCTSALSRPATVAQGICMAGGASSYTCTNALSRPETIAEAIEMIPYVDRTYWWDRFRDQYGNYQWRCRGGQTKQLADNSKCSAVTKDDERWPE